MSHMTVHVYPKHSCTRHLRCKLFFAIDEKIAEKSKKEDFSFCRTVHFADPFFYIALDRPLWTSFPPLRHYFKFFNNGSRKKNILRNRHFLVNGIFVAFYKSGLLYIFYKLTSSQDFQFQLIMKNVICDHVLSSIFESSILERSWIETLYKALTE